MRNHLLKAALLGALSSTCILGTGCSANIHDNTVNVDAKIDFKINSTVDVNNVKPGDSVAVTLNATGVVLVDPNTTPSPADAASAAYFKIFLDDTSSTELVATASASASVKIPAATPPGKHKLICGLYKHDGTATNQQQEVEITVVASATVTVTHPDGGA